MLEALVNNIEYSEAMIKTLMHRFEYVRVHVQGHGGQLSHIQGLVGGRQKAGPMLRAVVGNFDAPVQQNTAGEESFQGNAG